VIGERAAIAAALRAEGLRVRQIVAGAAARRLDGERYEADFSCEESLRSVREMMEESENSAVSGILNLLGLEPASQDEEDEAEQTRRIAAWTFHVVKVFAGALRSDEGKSGGWFVNVTALDGHFGLGPLTLPSSLPGGGEGIAASGTLGITKTLRREYPHLQIRNIDMEPAMPAEMLAARLLEELTVNTDLVEVGLTRGGRWRPALHEESIRSVSTPLPLDRESVVLITGGACGITGEITRALAAEAKSRLILVGRSALPQAESSRTAGRDRLALRRLFLEEAKRYGETVAPAEIERTIHRLLKDREMRSNLAACTKSGATVEYHALDVRDGAAFGRLIEELYERFGRIDGVIHGAGIVEDRRIRDKTLDSFDAVFRTKVDGAWTLARKLRPDDLRFLVFFGSVSGRFGNAGQVDYSAANEVLNKLADRLHRHWPGRVLCLNWGPWQGGMVSDDLRRLYAAAGVKLIPVERGVAAFLDELRRTDRGGAEVVLACGVEIMLQRGRRKEDFTAENAESAEKWQGR
jgi:NAD(P)-dependent dehydrogenase (short-subunit alcohol dehydrogenase family)